MKKNLTFKDFREELRKEYQMLGPSGYSVEEVEMEDVNGLPVASLRFTKVFGDKKSKPFDIRGAYEAYLAGFNAEIISFELFKGVDTFAFFAEDGYKVFASLVCVDKLENEGVRVNIHDIPHIMFTDLAMIFSIVPSVSSIRIPITDIDVDTTELLRNASVHYKESFIPTGLPMIGVTAGEGVSAAAVFYPGVLKETAKRLAATERLILIPSSTKEMLVLNPAPFEFDDADNESINQMIHSFNQGDDFFADGSEALSEHGYIYDCHSETLRIVA